MSKRPAARLAHDGRHLTDRLAAWIVSRRGSRNTPMVIGLCGAQGSGKSTLAAMLVDRFEDEYGLRAVCLSLDDFYFPKAERQRLAREAHPLLATRGPPGTHDTTRAKSVIVDLITAAADTTTSLPVFDKLEDERLGHALWRSYRGRPDVILFEGWCVGAAPQESQALETPVNALERSEDRDARWRRHVNAALSGPYAALFDLIDLQILLQAPRFDVVFQWRKEQEDRMALRSGKSGMTDTELTRFIMHYERLTRHIASTMPMSADLTVHLDKQRSPLALRERI